MSYGGHEFSSDNFGSDAMMSANPAASSGNKSAKKEKTPTDQQTLIPCTIKQIKTGAGTTINGIPLHSIKLVACVTDIEESSTHIIYTVEDGSGKIKVQNWINDEDAASTRANLSAITAHTYVRITGKVNMFNGEMTVTSHNIRLVRDVNEISYHWAECMFSFERANGKVGGSGIKPGATNGIGFGAGALGPGASQGMALEAGGAGNAVSDAVVEYIKTFGEESEQGASLQDMIQALGKNGHSEAGLRQAVQALSGDGLIYSTIDEETFKYAL